MKKTRWLMLAVALILVAAMFAGCAGQAPPPAQQSAPAPAPAPAKVKIKVGSDTTFAPLEFIDDKGKPAGFDIDLINEVCKEANLEPEIQTLPFDGLIAGLKSGQIDVAISSMTITDERKQAINFSDVYYHSGLSVSVQAKNETIKGFADLKGKRIAVQSGTTGESEAKKVEGAKVRSFTNSDQTFMELKNGGVDAVINDYPVTAYFIAQGNADVKIVGERLTSEDYGIAVTKNNADLVTKINEGLKKVKQNGKFAEFYKKWFGEAPPADLLK
ncbi:MAG: basic amino acid ABC transporter substrate-binding protein [Firmicutes bacterium]|nr:basic amino acid ABC transporter substrate-binding protein [Bacillota bacterium]